MADNKRNILLITSLYPADDIQFKNNTAVCHYFAKEWLRLGYVVRVINLYNIYPSYYYPALKLFKNVFADKFGIAILDKRKKNEHNYVIDGINVTRLPAYKSKPHGDFSEKVVGKLAERIISIVEEENFVPDFILGHFLLPSIRVISILKEKYPQTVTTIALHGKERHIIPAVQQCLPSINYIGYRSYSIKTSFETLYGHKPSFMCMSGIPSEFIVDHERTFDRGIHNFIYVGAFMRRKFPSCLIPAIVNNYPNKDFVITYVGDGNGVNDVKKEAKKRAVVENVRFTGRIPRSDINAKLDKAEVFIMISERETFGLVWLEAMARGCITVASRDEGMDGVIEDGVNGFLCKAGDVEELSEIVSRIKTMDRESLYKMSKCAIETAKEMTDIKMAERYIESISK